MLFYIFHFKIECDIHLAEQAVRVVRPLGSHFVGQFGITGQHLYMHQLEQPIIGKLEASMIG